jgi:hypothetical protein
MQTDVLAVAPHSTVAELYEQLPEGSELRRQRLYPVLDNDERLLGVLALSDIRAPQNSTSSAGATTVDITDNDLFSEPGEYERCQAIGAAAHQLGRYGVIAPSASRLGETLALFSTNLPVEQWADGEDA